MKRVKTHEKYRITEMLLEHGWDYSPGYGFSFHALEYPEFLEIEEALEVHYSILDYLENQPQETIQ